MGNGLPPTELMDQDACYARIVKAIHPDGLTCPRSGGDRFGVHRWHREPIVDYRWRDCRRAFNAFRRWDSRGALQHDGGNLDGPAELPPALRGLILQRNKFLASPRSIVNLEVCN